MKKKEEKKSEYNPNSLADREHEMARRKHHGDMEFWNIMGQVTDATPVEKQRKRDIADVLQEIFMLARKMDEAPEPHHGKEQKSGMVEENLARSLPQMSKQQLEYVKKEYTKKANKIKQEKVDMGKSLSNEDKIVLKTYQAINMELAKRRQQEQSKEMNQIRVNEQIMEPEQKDKKKKSSSKR